jgi:hypothetical protein
MNNRNKTTDKINKKEKNEFIPEIDAMQSCVKYVPANRQRKEPQAAANEHETEAAGNREAFDATCQEGGQIERSSAVW